MEGSFMVRGQNFSAPKSLFFPRRVRMKNPSFLRRRDFFANFAFCLLHLYKFMILWTCVFFPFDV